MSKLEELQKMIGYQFERAGLLRQALTHSSFANEKHLNLIKSDIEYKLTKDGNNYQLIFNSNVVSKFVEIYLDEHDIKFSDNFFDLIPGYEKVVEFASDKEITVDMIKIRSLVDSF